MSSAEFSEWLEFYKLEPFGRDAAFEGHALVTATIVNRSLGKNEKPAQVDDFMPKLPDPPQSTSQMMQVAQMMTVALGGQVKGEDGK